MRPEEIAALGELAGDAARATAAQAYEVHDGIAQRVWRAVGPFSLPVRLAHDVIARGAYSAAGEISGRVVRAGASAAGFAAAGDSRSIEDSKMGRAMVGALNGAFGDALHERGSRLALEMSLRREGAPVDASGPGLRRAYPDATGRLAVFLHGLGQTDDAWMVHAARHVPYGFRLQTELGYTPLFVRYNTGRRIAENGRELAALLGQVTEAWPTEVHEITLVGHSMGGLVARGACHHGAGSHWEAKVRHVFTLGSADGGAPLERLAGGAGSALGRLPETRGLAAALNARSAGIKDLGGGDPVKIPFAAGADHYFISVTAGARVRAIIGELFARGAPSFDLLNHPSVYEQIRRRLSSRPTLPAPRLGLPAASDDAQRP